MHWIEGSGKALSAVATLNGVAKRRRRRDKYEITTQEINELSKQNHNAVPKEHTFYSLSKNTMSTLAI